ncbi:MAG: hypothetical protein KJ046_16640, partial [Anaerolineae bacterium]|nr:hypothetical protein [Anaerolineae bacterium]
RLCSFHLNCLSTFSGSDQLVLQSFYRYSSILFIFFAFSIFAPTDSPNPIPLQEGFILRNFPDVIIESVETFKWFLARMTPIMLIILGILYPIYLTALMVNPKNPDGTMTTRKERLRQHTQEVLSIRSLKISLNVVIAATVLLAVFAFIPKFIQYLGGTEFSTFPENMDLVWVRFVGIAIMIYCLIAIFIIVQNIPRLRGEEVTDVPDSSTSQLDKIYQWAGRLAWIIIITVPVFTFNLYGSIPQQLGGGQPIRVHVLVADNNTISLVDKMKETYLLDRTNESVILLLNNAEEVQVVEIPNSKIVAILYNPVTDSE